MIREKKIIKKNIKVDIKIKLNQIWMGEIEKKKIQNKIYNNQNIDNQIWYNQQIIRYFWIFYNF